MVVLTSRTGRDSLAKRGEFSRRESLHIWRICQTSYFEQKQ